MRQLFDGDMNRTAFGSLFFVALPSCPWLLVDYWPLYPNVLSVMLLPALIVSFMAFWDRDATRNRRFGLGVMFAISLACEAFAQPNGVFSAVLFLVPFLVHTVSSRAFDKAPLRCRRLVSLIAGVVCFLLCFALWSLLICAPFLQGVVNYYWPPIYALGDAVLSVLGATFLSGGIAPVLAVALVAGVVLGVLRSDTRWIVCSFALASVVYVAATSLDDVWLKHFLAGFWYTDPYRVGAFASLCAVPVAALGAHGVCGLVSRLGSSFFSVKLLSSASSRFAPLCSALLSLLKSACFLFVGRPPCSSLPTVLGRAMSSLGISHITR